MNLREFVRGFEIDKRSGYTVVDVIRLLLLISRRPYGRIRLVRMLDLSEASVRTMVRRLKGEGLVEGSTKGLVLTERGKEVARKLNRKILVLPDLKIPSLAKGPCIAFVVRNSAGKVRLGIEQRDEGMKFNSYVVTLVYDGECVKFPGTGEPVRVGELPLERGDVLILSYGKYRERGGLAAALTLL